MRAGELRDRITVERRAEQSDGHDGVIQSWSPVYRRIAAQVHPLEGRDLERARQIDPRISHDVVVRYWRNYRNDLEGGRTRLVHHGIEDVTLEIVGPPIDVDGRHEWLRMPCREAA